MKLEKWLKNNNLTAGGSLDLQGTQIKEKNILNRYVDIASIKRSVELKLKWNNGYRFFDGIFCKVIKQIGLTFKVEIKGKIAFVIDDGKIFSHGETLKKAKENLIYKRCDRDKSEYETLTTGSEVSFEYAVEMYRVITGACEFGVKNFVSRIEKKEKYTVKEIIKITEGVYGSKEFKDFFVGDFVNNNFC